MKILKQLTLVFLFSSLILILFTKQTFAATLSVPSQYSTIQSAIDAASNGDVVDVAAGTYNEAINFSGKAVIVNGAGKDISILDGLGLNTSVVSVVSGETQNSILEGFTISNGEGTVWGDTRNGGGLFVKDSSITVRNIIFTTNHSLSPRTYGTAIEFFNSPSSSLDNIEVKSNNGGYDAISIFEFSNVSIHNSSFTDNSGMIFRIYTSGVFFENSIFENNTSDLMTVRYNDGNDYNPNTPVKINSSLIRNNINTNIELSSGGHIIIDHSVLSNNSTTAYGLIKFGESFLDVINSTIVNNTNPFLCDWCNSIVTNGGPEDPSYNFIINILNTAVWGNNGGNGAPITLPGNGSSPTIINYSLIQGGWPDTNSVGILNTDPLFADLSNGDFTLTSNSPAIDAGDPNSPLDPDGTRADMGAYPFFHQPTATEMINDLVNLVETFNLQQGINNSLDSKLEAALNALDDVNENNDQAAINSLQSFINSVEAQRGNQITNTQADQLIAAANEIISSLSN